MCALCHPKILPPTKSVFPTHGVASTRPNLKPAKALLNVFFFRKLVSSPANLLRMVWV